MLNTDRNANSSAAGQKAVDGHLNEPAEEGYRAAVYASYASASGLSTQLRSKYLSLAKNVGPYLPNPTTGGRVLDIGSGQGDLLALCRDRGIDAEGIDRSPELADACNRAGLKVTLVRDVAEFLSETSEYWTTVSLIDVLEHFSKEEAYRVLTLVRTKALRSGGRLVLQVPNMQSPFATLNLYHDVTHEWGYTEASIRQILVAAGFRDVRVRAAEYPWAGMYAIRRLLRSVFYLAVRAILLVDQPNRGSILTPSLIVVADS
jgi:2-polyprenyl-3-methyl-5-hydroxy-6-metoxy-1,4-benzoquinol methylase